MNLVEYLLYAAAYELLRSGHVYYWRSKLAQAALEVIARGEWP